MTAREPPAALRRSLRPQLPGLVACAMVGCAVLAAEPKTVSVVGSSSGPIVQAAGDTLSITLETVPGRGYGWTVDPASLADILRQVEWAVRADQIPQKAGAASVLHATFLAVKSGRTT